MNKTAIKNFAIWARNKLIADITYKAGLLGISENGIKSPLPQSTNGVQFFDIGTKEPYSISGIEIRQREALATAIRDKEKQSDYATAYKSVVEEVAYTWFNRLIAVRFMEVNDYLPSHIRVLSSESAGKDEPDLVTNPFDTDLEFTPYEKDRVMQLKQDNKLDELFRMLFIKQCNSLNALLPNLFEKTSDYTELLLNVAFTDKDGLVYRLVHDIAEDDFNVSKEGQVEIIGWLYQYYISERHDEVIDVLNRKSITKEDIPAATQLFTPDWVVRYMVDSSLGRYWIERNPQSKLREKLDFFVMPKSGDITYIDEKVEPKDLTFFDPCMGSGHILVYAFDVLMEIYRECGYSERDAAICILQDNIYGLDIDDRAYQLAYFAVMMKARSYNRRVLTMDISPNVCAIQESNGISKFTQAGITVDSKLNAIGEYLIKQYRHAKEIGSLQTVDEKEYCTFEAYLRDCEKAVPMDLFSSAQFSYTANIMRKLVQQAKIMSKKYTVVCTNPPYMNKLESHLKEFVINEYKPYSGDLFSVFMYRNFGYCKPNGYTAFMTPNVWLFIKSYEKLREYILMNKGIVSLIQMAKGAFFKEATVDICSFILLNSHYKNKGFYIRLEDYKGGMEVQKQKVLEALTSTSCGYFYETNDENFSKIPGSPVAYWVSEAMLKSFETGKLLEKIADTRLGMATANNNLFVRYWHEVKGNTIGFGCGTREESVQSKRTWFPYNSGGEYRRWYGNFENVVNWQNDGYAIRNYSKNGDGKVNSHNYNLDYIFKEGLTWSALSSSNFGIRYSPKGSLFDNAGSSLFSNVDLLQYLLGFLSSKITFALLKATSPTMNFQPGNLSALPVIVNQQRKEEVNIVVEQSISLSRSDWDAFETSWDFTRQQLLSGERTVAEAFAKWEREAAKRFDTLKANEEELNRIFIDIYGLSDELTPEVEDKDITVRRADLGREVRSLISYAVGCMFGRYSLDVEGLAYAGGEWDDKKYSTFIPHKDNILPITDEEYFKDDIVGLFVAFVKKVYGEETLEENLDFIAKALGNKGNTSREIIRNYFVKDFFKDHCKVYQKRPIYWLFDSGKADGFKALIYMHRYDENTIGNIRVDYLHKMQRIYEREIARMQETIDNSTNTREVAAAEKRKDKLTKQLKETKDYDEKIAHLALARIAIDLDDGVKVNYEKVQTGTDGKKLEVLAKI